ncbi:hypothetical protein DFP72DRAFT_345725 [Ephemerocybe angulata]|uniref:Protein kinase domain-containing protein n=1 Tax=Ephemerocybe angulata TaxID=980116 RepID=A0A8H6LSU1_9AGAR|nr:hypothetical protein DFP72DRAFT_345725 [Tulosesus angulatus]
MFLILPCLIEFTIPYVPDPYVFRFDGRFRFLSLSLVKDCWTRKSRQGVITHTSYFVVKEFNDDIIWKKELQVLEELRGLRGVARLLGSGRRMNGGPFIVTENAGEPTNKDVEEPSDWYDVAPLIGEIHARGWHHHDLHGGNVLNNGKGNLTVIDFGNAVRAADCVGDCPDNLWMDDI